MVLKRNILAVFLLMLLCVIGITALQFYYSFVNYKTERAFFEREINETLVEAADSVVAHHRACVVAQFKTWMRDTSFVKVSCRWNADSKTSVFTITDVGADAKIPSSISLSIPAFEKIRIDSLTEKELDVFVNHMSNAVRGNLNNNEIVFYTQKIGNRLSDAYYNKRAEDSEVEKEYKAALARKNIYVPFVIQASPFKDADFKSKEISITYSDANKHFVRAYFIDSFFYLLGQMKWVLGGSLVLLLITLGCFLYAGKIMLSQHKLNEIKDAFISNMTHEIHTPLASLSVTAEALKRFDFSPEEQREYVDIIYSQSRKLAALADEILEGARLERNSKTIETVVDVKELVAVLEQDVLYKKVSFSVPVKPVSVRGNVSYLEKMLRNLLDNALKYNNTNEPDTSLQITLNGKKVTIAIADNGPGIPDEYKQLIFDDFYRVPSGNVHNVKGYGLGLSFVKKVVAMHRGSVQVTDNQPQGTVFIIELPYESV